MEKILIDTDPGQDIDDLLAIIFALRRPELDIKAITTVTYPSRDRARLVKRLLRYENRNIPIAAGMQFPLRSFIGEERSNQYNRLQSMNHYCFAEPENSLDDPDSEDAVDLIIRTVEENPREITLACIAPLTNIATALCRKPDIAPKIKAIMMMGGEVSLNRGEHNVAFDYVAADIVFHSEIPVYMGTWDVTRRFVLSKEDCKKFHLHASPVCQALGKAIDVWNSVHSWKPGPVMYDIFPMVYVYDPSFYTMQEMSVQIETAGASTRGFTTACGGTAPRMKVTTDIRTDALRDLYLKTIFA